MVSITPAAADQVRRSAVESGAEELALRIAAHHDDATGELHYGIGFDERREQDREIEAGGILLLVSPLSVAAVSDLVIDFVEINPGEFRFIFYRNEGSDGDHATGSPH